MLLSILSTGTGWGHVCGRGFSSLSSDAKSLIVAVLGAIAGATAGGIVKWLLDRARINDLKELVGQLERQREEAHQDRRAALREREIALSEQRRALHELAKREAESQERQRKLNELQRIVDGRATDVEAQQTKLDTLLATLRGNEAGLWTTFPKRPPFPDFDARIGRWRPIIITVANNKGGVGKTTLVGNLLAYFDRQLKLKVLAIDLDYQGSLSTMLRLEQDRADERKSSVNSLFAKDAGLGTLFEATRRLGERLSRSELASAFYELGLLEDRLMVEWLVQEGGDDVRYRLASVLLQDGIWNRYDVILIDVPPRLTTGTINALCTSTHVLVPTIFNPIAAEPVANFIGTAKGLMDMLNPKLEFLGVVESMAPRTNEGQDTRAEGRRVIEEALDRSFPGVGILKTSVPRRTAIAEGGVAYLEGGEAKQDFR
jgi:cellulose biosynthesis protein BcsQ